MSFSDDEEMIPKKEKESDCQSDIKSEDIYDEKDYYNDNNKEYKEADYLPQTEPPKLILDINKKGFNDKKTYRQINETFVNFDEKFPKIKNEESLEDEFPSKSADEICENYKIFFKENIDYTSNSFDMYSKNHLRNTLVQEIQNLDWKNKETEIQNAKKETNAYEDIIENAFDKKTSYQLANINYLFDKELIKYDSNYEGFPVLTVGDNGGFTDYILYQAIKTGGYNPTIFVIPEKNNCIKDIKFRKEVKEKVEEDVTILYDFYEEGKDIDENSELSVNFLNNIFKMISEKTQENMVNLYIARKVIEFNPDYSQEIKYKKFLLINTLLAFKCLSYGGNFVIKLYDTFTPFTIGLIYIIFKNFESVSIFKPVTTRQYSSSRYLVAEKYLKDTNESTNNSIKYLEDFLMKYISDSKYDIQYFLYPSELRNNNIFLKIIPEINNDITEKRIDALKEIIKYINNQKTKLYDKMSIKKFFLDNWGLPCINYDESLLLKNQELKRKDKFGSNYKSKKLYTEKDLLKVVDDVGKLDEDQEKFLQSMFGGFNNKSKKTKKKEKEKEKEKTLEEKYNIVQNTILKSKKNLSPRKKDPNVLNKKRERKTNNKDNQADKKNTKYKIGKLDDDKKEKNIKEKDDFNDDDGEDILFG